MLTAAPGIHGTRNLFSRGEVSVADHVEMILATIREADAALGAFVAVAGDEARRQAASADERIRELGAAAWRKWPLLGVTVGVKDLIQTADLPTARGSLLTNRRPQADAPAVARLRAAGAIVVGKTATSEGGWSASTVSRVAPATANPWAAELSAGGSSGGSAAAVAAGLCSVALGTDGAGSIRIPAAFCGVVGFKPSFGTVPYVPPCADRLAHLGPIAATVTDAAELVSVLGGAHPEDPDSMAGAKDLTAGIDRPLRVGWLEFPGTTSRVRDVSERVLPVLTGWGHRIERVDVPFRDPYPALVDLLAAAEAADTDIAAEQWCDPDRLAVVRHGRTLSATAMIKVEQTRLALRVRLCHVMEHFDLLAMATVPIEPFDRHAIAPAWAARPEDLSWLAWSPASYPFNLTGQPALSLPAGRTAGGLPVGVQLVGAAGADALVLSVARQVEAALNPIPARTV
jgi:aspartyl-tRNA(Asn)/glutamyl-tRNA(Gln) amidotransferase subunit A